MGRRGAWAVGLLVVASLLPATALSTQRVAVASLDGEAGLVAPPDELPRPSPDKLGWPSVTLGHAVPDAFEHDTSNYMLGSAVAQLVLLESRSDCSADTETWDQARRDQVFWEVHAGLEWWTDQVPPGHDLSFTMPGAIVSEVCYEPITMDSTTGSTNSNQWAWLRQTMGNLGYPPGPDTCPSATSFDCATHYAVRRYSHDLRNSWQRDWGFVIFVADSLVDADGSFADGRFAYGYFSGPFMVMTYDNDGWGVERTNNITAHEVGHIFGATDEYATTSQWGYFWETDTPGSNAVMDTSNLAVAPSVGTQRQIGWRDTSPVNGRMDPLDTEPVNSTWDVPLTPTANATPTYAGTARDVAYPAHPEFLDRGYHSISINNVTAVEWEVDGVPAATTATDPRDPFAASFSHTLGPLADGWHEIKARPVNAVGNAMSGAAVHGLVVDTTAPEIGHTLDGAHGLDDWWTSDVEVTLSCQDALTGCWSRTATLDADTFSYEGPFPVTGEGAHALTYEAQDGVGNEATATPVTISIDLGQPSTTSSVTGDPGLGGWYRSDVTVELSCIDAASGCDRTEVDLGTGWEPYAGGFPVTGEGTHTVLYRSVDVAGHEEDLELLQVAIDLNAPAVSILEPEPGHAYVGRVQIDTDGDDGPPVMIARGHAVAAASDTSDGSGIQAVLFFADGVLVGTDTSAPYEADWQLRSSSGTALAAQEQELHVIALDRAGRSAEATLTYIAHPLV